MRNRFTFQNGMNYCLSFYETYLFRFLFVIYSIEKGGIWKSSNSIFQHVLNEISFALSVCCISIFDPEFIYLKYSLDANRNPRLNILISLFDCFVHGKQFIFCCWNLHSNRTRAIIIVIGLMAKCNNLQFNILIDRTIVNLSLSSSLHEKLLRFYEN